MLLKTYKFKTMLNIERVSFLQFDDNKIKELQKIEFDMLECFIEICEKENLTYFVLGGTTLGSVRHKGFIPWDDDVDVGMPREDYDKFLNIAHNYLPENYFLQSHLTDRNYPLNFAKIRNSSTTLIENQYRNIKMNHGVYIDVFPLDGYPSKRFEQLLANVLNKALTRRTSLCYAGPSFRKPKSLLVALGLCVLIPNYQTGVKLKDKFMSRYKYSASELVINYSGLYGLKEMMPKSYFGKGKIGEFNGREVVLPEKTEEYLTQLYGDYMTPPPIEKRGKHHNFAVFDKENTYINYIQK